MTKARVTSDRKPPKPQCALQTSACPRPAASAKGRFRASGLATMARRRREAQRFDRIIELMGAPCLQDPEALD